MNYEIQIWRHGVQRSRVALTGEYYKAVNRFRYEATFSRPGDVIELYQVFGDGVYDVQLLTETKEGSTAPIIIREGEDDMERARR